MNTKPVSLTKEQEVSVKYRGGSLLVSAAAGSGKTKVLVERLLDRIDNGDNIDEFLVITYTRAAAFELREKIYEELLKKLSDSPGNIRLRRQSLLCRGATIDTIHTFCAEILRENAHLVRLPPDFRVADESESAMILIEVIDDVLSKVYERNGQLPGFSSLIDTVTEGRDDKRLIETLLDLYKKLQSIPDPHAWIKAQQEKLKYTGINDVAETDCGAYLLYKLRCIVSYCNNEMKYLREEMKLHKDFELQYSESVDETIRQIAVFLKAFDKGWDEARRFSTVEFPRPKPIKGYDELKDVRLRCNKELNKCSKELEICSEEHIYDMKRLSPAITALLDIVLDLDVAYSEEKRRRGVADFSDLEHLTLSLLLNKETGERTEIAKNLSKRYKEILVDEYQDVNAVQELIFSLVSSDDNNVFMVGDVKQSIYRFRLADPSIFLSKYKSFREYETLDRNLTADSVLDRFHKNQNGQIGISAINGTKIHLSKNFRSCAEILETVNLIFSNIMSLEFGELEYSDNERLVPGRIERKGIQGKKGIPKQEAVNEVCERAVEVDIIDISQMKSDDQEQSPEAIKLEAEHIAEKISRLTDGTFMIPDENDGERAATCSDVVILLRSIKGKAWQYASALSERGIDSEFPGGEGFFEAAEMAAAISLLSIIDNPVQDIPLATVLCGPVYGFSSDEVAEIRSLSKENNLYEALMRSAEPNIASEETACKCRRALDDLEEMRLVSADMPVDRFIWHVYNKTGLPGIVSAMKSGNKRRNNLILLADSARRFEKSGYKGLFGFLAYIRNLQARGEVLSDGIDSKNVKEKYSGRTVKIMSIHKSKGLEFPVVFLAGTSTRHNLRDSGKGIVFHKDLGIGTMLTDKNRRIKYNTLARTAIQRKLNDEMLSEELRVLYVAMTRAKEKLIITGSVKNAERKIEKLTRQTSEKPAPMAVSSMGSMIEWVIAGIGGKDSKECAISLITDQVIRKDYDSIAKEEEGPDLSLSRDLQEPDLSGKKPVQDPVRDELTGAIKQYESFNIDYSHRQAPDLPSKLTVTGIKKTIREQNDISDPEAKQASWVQEDTKRVNLLLPPVFIDNGYQMSAAMRGTAMHNIMQYIDYEKGSNEDEIRKELEQLEKRSIISKEQAAEVDIQKIKHFFSSDIGKRACSSEYIKREFRFSILRPAGSYFHDGGDDKILLQGVIDCFFEEDGELVIIDFKTDKVENETIKEKAEQYTPQLDAYADALEGITDKRVKEKVIYFFDKNITYYI